MDNNELLQDIEEELTLSHIIVGDMDHQLLRGVFNRLHMLIENQTEYIKFIKTTGQDTIGNLQNEQAFLGILVSGLDRTKHKFEKLIKETAIPKDPHIQRRTSAGGKKRKTRKIKRKLQN